jgi:AcrR family transcriptional regulator
MPVVKRERPARTLRAEQAELTRRRILDAAAALFAERGYAATTIDAVATQAGVAVETVYSRFGNKTGILDGILQPAVAGGEDRVPLLERPEIAAVRACSDQDEQLRQLARFSRSILQRTQHVQRILRSAAAVDEHASDLYRRDREHRLSTQRAYIDMLLANGPLRPGLTAAEAADAYSALANPDTYTFLTSERRWSPERFEEWLCDTLTHTLLP